MKLFRLSSRGDTIVEVLLAITVVSSVMGGAFVSANNSLNTTLATQERGEALRQVESQLERLKARSAIDLSSIQISQNFCINNSLDIQTWTGSLDRAGFSLYPVDCVISPLGAASYHTSITYDSSAKIHRVQVLWERVGGADDLEQASIVYRAR